MALSEVVRKIDWYDLVFGLLEGWWCFNDGMDYPLQPAEFWLQCLKAAGFNESAVFGGSSAEARTQSIVLGCKSSRPPRSINYQHDLPERQQVADPSEQKGEHNLVAKNTRDLEVSTVPYKTVGDLEILADIYFPQEREMTTARPIGKPITSP